MSLLTKFQYIKLFVKNLNFLNVSMMALFKILCWAIIFVTCTNTMSKLANTHPLFHFFYKTGIIQFGISDKKKLKKKLKKTCNFCKNDFPPFFLSNSNAQSAFHDVSFCKCEANSCKGYTSTWQQTGKYYLNLISIITTHHASLYHNVFD